MGAILVAKVVAHTMTFKFVGGSSPLAGEPAELQKLGWLA